MSDMYFGSYVPTFFPLLPLMHFFGNLVLSCTLCVFFCLAPNGEAPSEKGILQISSSCPAPPFTIITPHFDYPCNPFTLSLPPLKKKPFTFFWCISRVGSVAESDPPTRPYTFHPC